MNVDEMLTGVRDAITVKRVYGDPIEKNGVTLIPAAKLSGGAGGGGDEANNGGGGFGLRARPVGAYIIRGNEVTWEPAVDVTRMATLGIVAGIVSLLVLRSIVKVLARR
ncbi:MAG TPA: sporulation protein [Candidatus Binatia bacterium]|nr:sporulation protein [Candidatus Binatia bacterium]